RALAPSDVVHEIYRRISATLNNPIWIYLVPEEQAAAAANALPESPNKSLFGVPFAVKDNIDVANLLTTAACPAFAYAAPENAAVVQRLLDDGAILIGKTNLDQFATGLVGVRSPYGACSNLFNPEYISGGSSSGSALAVASGLVSFALGTDTAGSGRVPAAFANIVGLKPTKGVLSTKGVVPACRSLDCVSIFSLTVGDAEIVFDIAAGYDAQDCYSRRYRPQEAPLKKCRIGIPADPQLDQVEGGYRALFTEAISRFRSLGHSIVTIDARSFLETANLLYGGPWVAERFAAVGVFIKDHPDSIHPVVCDIVLGGEKFTATDAFNAQYRLEQLRQETSIAWESMDVLLLPTAPNIYRIEEIEREPIFLNSRLGVFTNFTNLLDLAGIAVPAGFRADGLPFGVTLLRPAFGEAELFALGQSYLESLHPMLGATRVPCPVADPEGSATAAPDGIMIAVVGAHLTGEPLNHQLTDLDARFIQRTKTAPLYRMFALPASAPAKPGLVRVGPESGSSVELEVWELPVREFGKFVKNIPTPLTIGTIHLESGQQVKGFLCEEVATNGATDITRFGGWKAYCESLDLVR
ncbi:MAG: allophanate hydrolase, partial [Verrucomicrobia bacterium]|nr:allophanate hydrolase [Verrucomicrobiota bacterium]